MKCPHTIDWDLLALEVLEDKPAAPLLDHLRECTDCRRVFEAARRAHLDRIRMYDQLDHGHDDLREQLLAALPPQPARSRADRLVRGWRHMGDFTTSIKHKAGARAVIGVVSVAACIAAAVALVTFHGGRSAFAAAIEQFQNAKTIVCRISSTTSGGPMTLQNAGKLYISAEYGSRCEIGLTGMTPMLIQYAPLQGPATTVTPITRTYAVVDTQAVGGHGPLGADSPDAFILALSKLKGEATRELGRMTLDGVDAFGYEIAGQLLGLGSADGVRSELWVDAKTYLPVRCVAEIPVPEIAGGKGGVLQLVYDQFEWDTPLDPKLFVPDIPADYTRVDAKAPAPDEATLIKGLGNYAELAGKYPPALNASTMVTDFSAAVANRMASAMARGEKAPDQKELMQKAVEIGSGISFYQKLAREGHSPEYHGKTVKPGQADAVLLRWKLTEGQWRVIYGDLRVDTISAE
jgi:hypothetical protein